MACLENKTAGNFIIGFLICSEVYWKMGIVEKSNYCAECATNTSPSEEVTQCIQMHLEAMK